MDTRPYIPVWGLASMASYSEVSRMLYPFAMFTWWLSFLSYVALGGSFWFQSLSSLGGGSGSLLLPGGGVPSAVYAGLQAMALCAGDRKVPLG